MKRIIQWFLISIGTALCIVGAAIFWHVRSSCGIPVFVLAVMGIWGFTGFIAFAFDQEGYSPHWNKITWVVCGGLVALTVIGVLSIGPWVLFALLSFGSAALLSGKLISRRTLVNLGVFAISAIINFGLLFAFVKGSGSEIVQIPQSSLVTQNFPGIDFFHANRVRLPAEKKYNIESLTKIFLATLSPCWDAALGHVPERDEVRSKLRNMTFQPGTRAGGFEVFQKTVNEIIMGENVSHLDYRVSVLASEENGFQWITITTVVHFNNWKGRAYFIPVGIAHQILMADAMRKFIHKTR